MIPVYRGSDYFEAQLLVGLIQQAGLHVFLQGADLQGGLGEVAAIGYLCVWVKRADQQQAEEIIARYQRGDFSLAEDKPESRVEYPCD